MSADYFKVLGIPVSSGRAFTNSDDASAPAVAIVNEWAARRWWPNENAVGRTFTVDTAPGIRAVVTVVGVVRDNLAGQGSILLAKVGPEVYRPFKQSHFWIATYYARTHGESGRIVEDAKKAVMRAIASNGRPQGGLLSAQVDGQLQTVRTNATQIAGFAVVGLLLAITGLYGVLSYVVQQRTREIGIRGVLGAGRADILGMVLSEAMALLSIARRRWAHHGGAMRLMGACCTARRRADVAVYAAVSTIARGGASRASFPARRAAAQLTR